MLQLKRWVARADCPKDRSSGRSATPAPSRRDPPCGWLRMPTGRANIIVFHGGFHGRTLGAASLTTSGTKVRTGFHPLNGPALWLHPFHTLALRLE